VAKQKRNFNFEDKPKWNFDFVEQESPQEPGQSTTRQEILRPHISLAQAMVDDATDALDVEKIDLGLSEVSRLSQEEPERPFIHETERDEFGALKPRSRTADPFTQGLAGGILSGFDIIAQEYAKEIEFEEPPVQTTTGSEFGDKALGAVGGLVGILPSFLVAGGVVNSLKLVKNLSNPLLKRVVSGALTFPLASSPESIARLATGENVGEVAKSIGEETLFGALFGALPPIMRGKKLKNTVSIVGAGALGYSMAEIEGGDLQDKIINTVLLAIMHGARLITPKSPLYDKKLDPKYNKKVAEGLKLIDEEVLNSLDPKNAQIVLDKIIDSKTPEKTVNKKGVVQYKDKQTKKVIPKKEAESIIDKVALRDIVKETIEIENIKETGKPLVKESTKQAEKPQVKAEKPTTIETATETIFELKEVREHLTPAEKTKNTNLIKLEVNKLKSQGIDARYEDGKLFINGERVTKPRVKGVRAEIEDATNPKAIESFEKLSDKEQARQTELSKFVEPKDLPDGMGKKALAKGQADIKADAGRELSKEAQLVREAGLEKLKEGHQDRSGEFVPKEEVAKIVDEAIKPKEKSFVEKEGITNDIKLGESATEHLISEKNGRKFIVKKGPRGNIIEQIIEEPNGQRMIKGLDDNGNIFFEGEGRTLQSAFDAFDKIFPKEKQPQIERTSAGDQFLLETGKIEIPKTAKDVGKGKGAEGTPLFEQKKVDKGQLELKSEKPKAETKAKTVNIATLDQLKNTKQWLESQKDTPSGLNGRETKILSKVNKAIKQKETVKPQELSNELADIKKNKPKQTDTVKITFEDGKKTTMPIKDLDTIPKNLKIKDVEYGTTKGGKFVSGEFVKFRTVEQAKKNIDAFNKENLGRANLGVDPSVVKDYVVVGAKHLENVIRGGVKKAQQFKEWSKPMLKDFGQKIKPHLLKVWAGIKKAYGKKLIEYSEKNPFLKTSKVIEGDFESGFENKITPETKTKPKTPSSYEKLKDDWFSNRDWESHKANVEANNFQGNIQNTIRSKPTFKSGDRFKEPLRLKWEKEWQDIDQAIHIHLDLKANPSHLAKYYDKLTVEQKRIVDIAQNLTPEQKSIADKISKEYDKVGKLALASDVIRNTIDNYVARTWDIKGKGGAEFFRKFGVSTRHAKQRVYETILEGQSKGLELLTKGASNNLATLKTEINNAIESKRLIKEGLKLKDENGENIFSLQDLDGYKQIEHPNFKWWKFRGKVNEAEAQGRNFVINKDGTVLEKVPIYAPESIAKNLNNILGQSKLKGVPGVDFLTKYNAAIKATILQTSLFHHQAFARSYMLGGAVKKGNINPVKAYAEGLKAIKEQKPEVELLVRNGLTLGRIQDWSEVLLQQKSSLGKILDKNKVSRTVKDKILLFQEKQAHSLFAKFGAGLKAQAGLLEYRKSLKENPTLEPNARAKMVANLINEDFGGLHLQRLGRNPTLQHIFRLLALAPDWTESNVRTMVKAVKSGEKAETQLYRQFWGRIIKRGMLTTTALNFLIAGFDTEDDNGKEISYIDAVKRRYKKAWDKGYLRWLMVDVTPVYKAIGGGEGKRSYFSIFGHFLDPVKFIAHPVRSAKHKSSVIGRAAFEALMGTDWRGREFTNWDELVGLDDKGVYKSNRKGKYQKGDPKGGKLAGQLTKFSLGGGGAVEYGQIPSYLATQGRQSLPIQLQSMWSWLSGEMDGLNAMAKGLGFHLAVTKDVKQEQEKPKDFEFNKSKSKREFNF